MQSAFWMPFTVPSTIRLSLLSDLGGILASESAVVRLIPFGCEDESVEWFNHRAKGNRHATLLHRQDRLHASSGSTTRSRWTGQERSKSGRFFVLQHPEYPKVFVALTVEPSVFFDKALMPFLGGLYPKVLLTFITHQRLKRLIDEFKASGGTKTSLSHAHPSASGIKKARTSSTQCRWSVGRRCRWMRLSTSFTATTAGFRASNSRSMTRIAAATISVTRQGIVKANALLQRAYKGFTIPVCKTIHENINLFSRRARLAHPDLSTSPLVIEFDADQFGEVEENKRLVQAMRKLRTASVSVLHGNPYLHLSLLDYLDGSAFDLWVLDDRRIIIVPQLKGSVASIKRLVNHIFDDYAEGHLSSYQGAGQ